MVKSELVMLAEGRLKVLCAANGRGRVSARAARKLLVPR